MQSPYESERTRVYVVEDDEDLCEEMVLALDELGFYASGFRDAGSFYKAFAVRPCHSAVLDIGLPGEDGLSIVSHLRAVPGVRMVMVTARGQLKDRLEGLRRGADAYLVKPVHLDELAETLRALNRRAGPGDVPAAAPAAPSTKLWRLVEGDWVLSDPVGRRMTLTSTERAFLTRLFANPGSEVSRADLILALGGDSFDFSAHRVDAIAHRLRRKAQRVGMTLPLHSVRGIGYVFAEPC